MLREGLEAGPQRGLYLAERSVRAPDGRRDGLGKPLGELVDQRQEERLLVGKVVVDGALRRARGADDVVDGGSVVPFFGENPERGLENPVARRLLAHEDTP